MFCRLMMVKLYFYKFVKKINMKKIYLVLVTLIISNFSYTHENCHKFEKDEFEVRYIKNPIHLNEGIQYQLRNSAHKVF